MSSVTDFMQGENVSLAIAAAVENALQCGRVLHFPAGEYHFYPDGCRQKYCFFSNNDEGVKTIAVLLENIDDFTVSGDNAKLIFHGRISPLCAFNCRNLTVKGVTVDFEDSFVSDADLVRRENGTAWFRFYGKHRVENGRIIFTGDFYDNFSGQLPFSPYDREKNELVYNGKTVSVPNGSLLYKDGLVGTADLFENAPTDAFVVKHEIRFCPGMVFDGCENVALNNVTLHHAAGMGALFQCCTDCTIDGLTVAPSFRRTSVSDDALHITDCRGKIRIANSKLSGTLDDSINVHGVFRKLKSRIPGGKMYYLEAGHYQQQGVFNIRPGDTIEILNRADGKPYGQVKIDKASSCNKSMSIIAFDESTLPDGFVQGDPAWIIDTQAELEVVNTECRPLRGRGVLASGLKNIHIHDCYFHSSGAGIFISGDHAYWYEAGPVRCALIENNLFDNCNYFASAATREPLTIFPELNKLAEGFYYHGTITVKNNRFRSTARPLVSMMSVTEAVVCGNVFEADDRYPFAPDPRGGYYFTGLDSPAASFLHCGRIVDENNPGFCEIGNAK